MKTRLRIGRTPSRLQCTLRQSLEEPGKFLRGEAVARHVPGPLNAVGLEDRPHLAHDLGREGAGRRGFRARRAGQAPPGGAPRSRRVPLTQRRIPILGQAETADTPYGSPTEASLIPRPLFP